MIALKSGQNDWPANIYMAIFIRMTLCGQVLTEQQPIGEISRKVETLSTVTVLISLGS